MVFRQGFHGGLRNHSRTTDSLNIEGACLRHLSNKKLKTVVAPKKGKTAAAISRRASKEAHNAWLTRLQIYERAAETGLLGLMAALLILAPYFRGLYFPTDQLVAFVVVGVLFALRWMLKLLRDDARFLIEPLDYLALALVACYVLSGFVAVNAQSAVISTLMRLMEFMVFWLAASLVTNVRRLRLLILAIGISAALWSLVGVLAAAGISHFPGAFAGSRINSVFQYPDAAAAYFLLGLFGLLGLWVEDTRSPWRLVYSFLAGVIAAAFLLTYSRGAWLIAPFAAALFLIALPKGSRLHGLLLGLATLIGAGVGVGIFVKSLGGHPGLVAGSDLLAGAVALGLGLLVDRFMSMESRQRQASGLIFVLLVSFAIGAYAVHKAEQPLTLVGLKTGPETRLLVAGALHAGKTDTLRFTVAGSGPKGDAFDVQAIGVSSRGDQTTLLNLQGSASSTPTVHRGLIVPTRLTKGLLLQIGAGAAGSQVTFDHISVNGQPISMALVKILPASIYDRAIAINPDQLSVWERGIFYGDALKMIGQRPLLGWGGGGWAAAYLGFQSFGYFTTQVHDAYLQTFVDAGALGFAVLAAFLVFFLMFWYRTARRLDPKERSLLAGAATGAMALAAHAAIDFDLSLIAIAVTLFAVIGALRGLYGRPLAREDAAFILTSKASAKSLFGAAAMLAALGVSIYAGILQQGLTKGQVAASLLAKNNAAAALPIYQQAVADDPLGGSLWIDIGQIQAASGVTSKNPTLVQQGINDMQKGMALDRRNPRLAATVGAFLYDHGYTGPGLADLRRSVQLQPYSTSAYQDLAQGYELLANADLNKGDVQAAQVEAKQVLKVAQAEAAMAKRVPSNLPTNLLMPPATAPLEYEVGQAQALLGEDRAAEASLQSALSLPDGTAQITGNVPLWQAAIAQATGSPSLIQEYPVPKAPAGAQSEVAALVKSLKQITAHGG